MSQTFRLAFSFGQRNPTAILRAPVSRHQHGSAGVNQIAPAGRARIRSWELVWGLLAAALLLL